MSKAMNKSRYLLKSLLRSAWRNRDGMAATEFAMLLPIMVPLFFGVLEISDAMTINRRVSTASNTVVDIAAQVEQLTPSQIESLIDSIAPILDPGGTSSLNIKLVSVIVDSNDKPRVHWSVEWHEDDNPATANMQSSEPYTRGQLYTNLGTDYETGNYGLLQLKNRSLLVLEMDYPYQPRFAKMFVRDPINFERFTKRAPRLETRVQLCDNLGNNCTT